MLEAARARQGAGVDVVIGWVETHGRAETEALLPGLERLPPRSVEYRGATLQRVRSGRRPRPPAGADPGRRAGPHERRRLPPRQALAGRDGAARRRHRRLHHAERPAPREPERRRRARDRRPDARDRPGLDHRSGRRGGAGRLAARRADPAPPGREGVRPGAGGRGRPSLLPQGQPDRAPGAGAPDHRGARRRPDGGLPPRPRRAGDLARGRAHPGLRQPESPRGPRRAGRPADGRRPPGRVGGRQRRDAELRTAPGQGPRPRRGDAPARRAARRRDRHADGPRRARRGPRLRAPPQRHAHRPGEARAAALAGGPVRVGRQRAGPTERRHRRLRHHRGARRARSPPRPSGALPRPSTGAATGRPWGSQRSRPQSRG